QGRSETFKHAVASLTGSLAPPVPRGSSGTAPGSDAAGLGGVGVGAGAGAPLTGGGDVAAPGAAPAPPATATSSARAPAVTPPAVMIARPCGRDAGVDHTPAILPRGPTRLKR